MPDNLAQLSAFAAPERIGLVKFILEGYDDLAILSTADRNSGEITIRFHPARGEELLTILDDLQVAYDKQAYLI